MPTEEFYPYKQVGRTCTHCTIAMFAKVPVHYVTNHFTPSGKQHDEWYNMAWYFGLQVYADKIPGMPPNDGKWYIIRFKYSGRNNGHLAGWKDGHVYCSCSGKYRYYPIKGEKIDYHIGFLKQP